MKMLLIQLLKIEIMSNLTIHVDILAGTELKEAMQDAKGLCIHLGVAYVTFRFNSLNCSISSEADLEALMEEYDRTAHPSSIIG